MILVRVVRLRPIALFYWGTKWHHVTRRSAHIESHCHAQEGENSYYTYHEWNTAEKELLEEIHPGQRFFSLNRAALNDPLCASKSKYLHAEHCRAQLVTTMHPKVPSLQVSRDSEPAFGLEMLTPLGRSAT